MPILRYVLCPVLYDCGGWQLERLGLAMPQKDSNRSGAPQVAFDKLGMIVTIVVWL